MLGSDALRLRARGESATHNTHITVCVSHTTERLRVWSYSRDFALGVTDFSFPAEVLDRP
jgi:hypothetical protein